MAQVLSLATKALFRQLRECNNKCPFCHADFFETFKCGRCINVDIPDSWGFYKCESCIKDWSIHVHKCSGIDDSDRDSGEDLSDGEVRTHTVV